MNGNHVTRNLDQIARRTVISPSQKVFEYRLYQLGSILSKKTNLETWLEFFKAALKHLEKLEQWGT